MWHDALKCDEETLDDVRKVLKGSSSSKSLLYITFWHKRYFK